MPIGDFPVVLTADRTIMAAYPLLLDGMGAAAQTTFTPSPIMTRLIAPRVACDGLRVQQAPLGLRRIEAALRRDGFGADDVAVVAPENLGRAIGPRTRVVGLASGDPLGIGMNSTTMTGIFGRRPYTSARFLALLGAVRGLVDRRCPAARIVVGGPGMWQLAPDAGGCRHLGIDHVVTGYCEGNVADLFRRIAAGEDLPLVLAGRWSRGEEIPRVLAATVMGMVEVSRGCGWGCRFCTLAHQPMAHLPPDTVLADVETNLRAGVANISLGSEDIFRYGAEAAGRPAPQALLDLLRRLRALPAVNSLAIDHANIVTAAAFADSELAELHALLSAGRPEHLVWVNLGVETASGELLAANGGAAKIRPYPVADWADVCLAQVRRLCRHGFLPMISLVIGMPGETPQDTDRTLAWVDQLRDERVAVVPVFHTPVAGDGGRIAAAELTPRQWEIFDRSLRLTFTWMPRLYWQHHGLAKVPQWRRVLMQLFGRVYAPYWKFLVRRRMASSR